MKKLLLLSLLLTGCTFTFGKRATLEKACKIYEEPPACSNGWIKEIDGFQCIKWTEEEQKIHDWARERQE